MSWFAESTGDVNPVAGVGGAAQHGLSARDAAAADDIRDYFVEAREISACERDLESSAESEQSFIKPLNSETARHGERDHAENWLRAHGRDIGQAAREGDVADVGGGVGFESEVAAFEHEIGGEDQIFVRARAQDRTIVANAANERRMGGSGEAADSFDDSGFTHWQGRDPREFLPKYTAKCGEVVGFARQFA